MKSCFAVVKASGAGSKYKKMHSSWFELMVVPRGSAGEEKYWEKQQGEVKVNIGFLFIPITAVLRVGFGSLGTARAFPSPGNCSSCT